ncbi:MAG: T9SS type A sorting domain-containing protein [Bacteroidia bacterium]
MKNWLFGLLMLIGGGNLLAQTEYDWEIIYEKEGVVLNTCDNWKFDRIVAMGDNGAVLRSYNKGQTWEDVSDATLGNITSMDLVDNDTIFASNGYDVFRSFDFGDSWEKVFTSDEKINYLGADFLKHRSIFLGADYGTVLISNDFGAQWRNLDLNEILNDNEHVYGLTAGLFQGDTTYGVTTSYTHELLSIDNFKSIRRRSEWGDSKPIMVNYYCDEVSALFGGYFAVTSSDGSVSIRDNSGTIGWSFNNAKKAVNCVKGYPFFMNNTDNMLTYAVGENGYIMKAKNLGAKRMVDDDSSPTNNDLNWIDMGHPGRYRKKYDYWTMSGDTVSFIAVGDGIIIRKRFNWEPDPVSINENSTPSISASVFPNPSNGAVNVVVPNLTGLLNVLVVSMSGQVVFSQNCNQNQFTIQGLTKGVYTVRVASEQGLSVKKLVVQ